MASASHTATAAPSRLPREHLTVLALLIVSAFVVILNETTMGVALYPIMEDLGIGPSRGQWLTTAFMLTMAIVIPMSGFLLQRLGTRRTFTLAMTLFALGTLSAALAPTFGLLLAGRVVQASGTAVMMPLLMTTVMSLVPPGRRGQFMGTVSLVISAAPAMGPAVSGALTSAFGWRGVFWTVLPIAVIALGIGVWKIRDVTVHKPVRLDPLSPPLAALGFGSLVYGLASLGEAAELDGAEPPIPPGIAIAVGAVFIALFVWRQLRLAGTPRVLMDVRVFATGQFALALSVMAVGMIALFGVIVLLPLVLQNSMGLSPVAAGAVLAPGGLAMGLLGPVVGRFYDQVGPRPLVLPGVVLAITAFLALSTIGPDSHWSAALGGHLLLSLALALLFTPLMTTALGSLPPALYSHGSATLSTVQQLVGAAGVAGFVAVMTMRETTLIDAGVAQPEALASGAGLAFLVGAGVLLICGLLALRLRKPAPLGEDVPAPSSEDVPAGH